MEFGIQNDLDRQKILKVFQRYNLSRSSSSSKPSAPPLEEASAPPIELLNNEVDSECVICMDQSVSEQKIV